MQKIFILLTIFFIGCKTTLDVTTRISIAESNKEVLILSALIRDYFKRTRDENVSPKGLIQNDTSKRILNNFEWTEAKRRGGYISVYYKLSKSRDKNIELTNKEREMLSWSMWTTKKLTSEYDGEIRFAYSERFYHIKKIIVKKE